MIFFFLLLSLISNVLTLENGLAKTPPMGWLSWERFKCKIDCHHHPDDCISEQLFKDIANVLIDRGYLHAGYNRINIDDCWSKRTREFDNGELLPDTDRFPNGMEYLSEYMHDRGLKLGIYQNLGKRTCMGYPGILGNVEKDVKTFAKWKIDMIKLDACFTQTTKLDNGYIKFRQEVEKIKRPMLLSCSWPYYQIFTSKTHIIPNWQLISMNCNMFRVYHDITTNWNVIQKTIDFMGDNQAIFRSVTGPGSWPDPDMLMIGNPELSISQCESQMAIWCLLPAPLLMSNDPRNIDEEFEKILLNQNAIEINQDKMGEPGERIFHNTTMDLWRRILSNNQMAFVVLNRLTDNSLNVSIKLEQVEIEKFKQVENFEILNIFRNNRYRIKRQSSTIINANVEPMGVVFLKLTPI